MHWPAIGCAIPMSGDLSGSVYFYFLFETLDFESAFGHDGKTRENEHESGCYTFSTDFDLLYLWTHLFQLAVTKHKAPQFPISRMVLCVPSVIAVRTSTV